MKNYCGKCNNGTIIKIDPITHEEYTDYCSCRLEIEKEEDIEKKLKRSRIPKDYWGLTFNDYVNPTKNRIQYSKNLENIAITKKYIENLEYNITNGFGLYLCGENNSGKTMLMCIILREALERGFKVSFFTMSEIISWYMSNWFDEKDIRKDISVFKDCDLLGIDDCFDKTKTYVSSNSMQVAQIDDLFRYRVHNWKSFILTANIPKESMSVNTILNKNIIGLLDRKTIELNFYGNISTILQEKLKREIAG